MRECAGLHIKRENIIYRYIINVYIALCLVVNIKCIVCVFKGGGSQWIANQTKDGQAFVQMFVQFCVEADSSHCVGKKDRIFPQYEAFELMAVVAIDLNIQIYDSRSDQQFGFSSNCVRKQGFRRKIEAKTSLELNFNRKITNKTELLHIFKMPHAFVLACVGKKYVNLSDFASANM